MQEKEIVNDNDVRLVLDEKIKQGCRDALEELFELYEQTNPAGGSVTERNKDRKAISALMKIGLLTETLSEWAEDHLIGFHHRKQKLNIVEMSARNSNSHKNELAQYEEDVFAHASCSCELCPECFFFIDY